MSDICQSCNFSLVDEDLGFCDWLYHTIHKIAETSVLATLQGVLHEYLDK